MQYRRAVALTKRNIQKEKLLSNIQSITTEDVTPKTVIGAVIGRVFGKLTILDYLLLGFKLSRKAVNIWKAFHKK